MRQQQPKEWANPHREKRQDGQKPGCQVAKGGERGEISRQIGADNAWKDKDKPEEAEAVQSGDGAVRIDPVPRLELRQDVHAEAKQPRDIAQSEM
jgi:hypothetical protein